MNTNVVIGTLINEEPVSFDTYRQIIRHTPIIQDQNSTMNSTIPQGIPIIIPNLIMEVDEDDEMISEMICPEIFEGNIISGWSDSDGSEGMYINGIFDEDETDDEYKAKIKRNVEHLEIIKAYKKLDGTTSIWTSESFTDIDAAITKGKTLYS